MPFYRAHIYPRLVDWLGDPPPIHEIRRQVIPLARGTVLEIGAGAGANFPHYDSAKVTKLYALEPNREMIRLADVDVEFLTFPGERIPLDTGTVDTVVSTFTLCTIADVVEAVQGLGRVLTSDGKLIFVELEVSPDPAIRRWQQRLEPIQHWLFEGLQLTRNIPALLRQGGFQIEHMSTRYLAEFPKSLSYCIWGTAIYR